MRLNEVMAPLASALLVAGYSGEQASASGVSAQTPTQEQIALTPDQLPIQKSLNSFRNRVLLKHQAIILMEACVAWPNDSGGVTVTWNPGIGEVPSAGGGKERYYIFSYHDSKYHPPWGPLNGAPMLSPQAMTLAFRPKHPIKGGLDRKLSTHEARGANGISHYNDIQTGEPVMATALVKGPFTSKHVAEICVDLRDDTPLSGIIS